MRCSPINTVSSHCSNRIRSYKGSPLWLLLALPALSRFSKRVAISKRKDTKSWHRNSHILLISKNNMKKESMLIKSRHFRRESLKG